MENEFYRKNRYKFKKIIKRVEEEGVDGELNIRLYDYVKKNIMELASESKTENQILLNISDIPEYHLKQLILIYDDFINEHTHIHPLNQTQGDFE